MHYHKIPETTRVMGGIDTTNGESKLSTRDFSCQMKGGIRMSHGPMASGDFEFLQAIMKRGFVNIPRMLFDYMADLELDYDTVGRLYAVMACVGGHGESAFGEYTISRKANLHDFEQLRNLILDLEQKDLVRSEEEGDKVTFSFIPLFYRLRVIWLQYLDQYEQESGEGMPDPALATAERLLGRPLSDREVRDIQDWYESYDYGAPMVEAIIREGLNQGVTRMNYLNQIARQWHEEGVRTPDDAEAFVQRYRKSSGKHKAVIQYLGLKRQPNAAEHALLDKWTQEWGFSNEVIIRACAEAVGSQNPFQYVNRILERWAERGVKTIADAEVLMQSERRAAPASQPKAAARTERKTPPRSSNVILQREKKDDRYYDHIFKKFGE